MASQFAFRLRGEPQAYFDPARHPSNRLRRGAVVFSIDFEMAWAWQYAKNLSEDCVTIGLRERSQVPEILARLDEHRIPATWATVGHLFLESCCRDADGAAHPEMLRPNYFESKYLRFASGDWYQHDPCGDIRSAPAWYGADLVEKILAAEVKHEIACHSFSHVSFACITPEVAAAELDACIEAMKRFDLRPVTYVFPTNESGNFNVLIEKGFKIIRAFPGASAVISLPVKRDDGLWAVHDSSGIEVQGDGWDLGLLLSRLKSIVDKAASTRMAAHFWFHPSMQPEQLRKLLFPLLRYCAEQRNRGMIDILTMEQLVQTTEDALK